MAEPVRTSWTSTPRRSGIGGPIGSESGAKKMRFSTRDNFRMPQKLVEYLAGLEGAHYTEYSDCEPHSSSSESSGW